MFSPEQFLDMTITESNDTKATPVPVGEYTGIIEEVKPRNWASKADPSKAGVALDIIWSIDDYEVKQALGRDRVTVKQGVMLDLSDSGGLDMGKGKNLGLGRLREACNLNTPGQPFSFSMLVGRLAKIRVEHRIGDDNIFAEVRQVAKMA